MVKKVGDWLEDRFKGNTPSSPAHISYGRKLPR